MHGSSPSTRPSRPRAVRAMSEARTCPSPAGEKSAGPDPENAMIARSADARQEVIAPEKLESLLRLGVRAFPVTSEKVPCFTGWQASATGDLHTLGQQAQQAGRRYGGIGLVTGEVVSVLDLDGPAALDAMLDLAAEADDQFPQHGQLVGRTPRGGLHVYYRTPEGENHNNVRLHDLPVDWRGRGGLVVAFGPHRSLSGHLIPPEPRWLRSWRASAASRHATADEEQTSRDEADQRMTTERYFAILTRIATQEEGKRNAVLWWGARVVWGSWFCTPPAGRPGEDEVRHDLERAGMFSGLDGAEVSRSVASAQAQARRDVGGEA